MPVAFVAKGGEVYVTNRGEVHVTKGLPFWGVLRVAKGQEAIIAEGGCACC